jgi:glycosyltransferase involved in cell wall biosynthesis
MEKVVIKKADGLSSPSKMLAKIVADSLNFKKDKIKIIPNLVDTSFFSPSNRKAASPIVLFVGRLERIKGADILIEAINKIDGNVPDAEFMLIGDSTPDFRIKLTARIKEYHLQNKVNLLGKIDYLKLPAYYQKASLFVIPSRWDNFPGSCLEAEASGLPIIASSVGGLKEQLVKDGKNGFLVAPENASELAQKMSLLLKNPELRQQMGQESLKIVKNYQPSCVAEKMVEYYRQIIIKKKEQK